MNPMQMADEFAKFVEAMTGLKAQFVAAGWGDQAAEEMVIIAMKSGQTST